MCFVPEPTVVPTVGLEASGNCNKGGNTLCNVVRFVADRCFYLRIN
jgi:hypothetical protein